MVRFKNRYVLVHVESEKCKGFKLTQQEVAGNLKKAVQTLFGDYGAASIANFGVKYFHEKHKLLVVRVSKGPHRFLTSILPLLTKTGSELVNYRILYTGATIRLCKTYILKYQNNFIRYGSSNEISKLLKQLE